MPKFCANLSWLFPELPFPDRFKAAKEAGASITLKNYVRFQLGEGIEKEETDFAAEVAAAAGA